MVPPPVTAPPVIESTRPVPPVEPLAATPPPAPPPLPPAEAPRSATGFYGAENPDARVVIRATQRAWVRVSQGSQILFARILEPGETYRVPNQPDLTLDAGNLGGTEITVDGRTLPPLGGNGVPRSKIPISPQALLERPAAAN
jgi:cytoskeleton protein RodZ